MYINYHIVKHGYDIWWSPSILVVRIRIWTKLWRHLSEGAIWCYNHCNRYRGRYESSYILLQISLWNSAFFIYMYLYFLSFYLFIVHRNVSASGWRLTRFPKQQRIPHRFASGWNWDHSFGIDLPLEMWQTVCKDDGVPPHSFHFAMQYLSSHYPSQRLGWNGPVVWPPWWRHLTPANFNLAGLCEGHNLQQAMWDAEWAVECRWSGWDNNVQHNLKSFIGAGVLVTSGLIYALTVMLGTCQKHLL